MSMLKTGFVASALIVSLGLATAPGVFAKGHNQGVNSTTSDTPGTKVGSETVANSQQEGAMQGNGKAVSETPAGETPGNSGNAGRPGGGDSGPAGDR